MPNPVPPRSLPSSLPTNLLLEIRSAFPAFTYLPTYLPSPTYPPRLLPIPSKPLPPPALLIFLRELEGVVDNFSLLFFSFKW